MDQKDREDERNYLRQVNADMARDYDRLVTTISAGGIGLTLLLLREWQDATWKWAAVAGAILFLAGLLCILASYVYSQRSTALAVERLDAGEQAAEDEDREKSADVWVESLNVAAAVCLVIGAASITAFVAKNA